jgi:O-methyltransferase
MPAPTARMKELVRKFLHSIGYRVVRTRQGGYPLDFRDDDIRLIRQAMPYTMTTPERLKVLIDSVRYLTDRSICGAFLECGVWKGGSMMAAALALSDLGETDREIVLCDVYDALLPVPTKRDYTVTGDEALTRGSAPQPYWNFVTVDDVRSNMEKTGYPPERIRYVRGQVEVTIPEHAPEHISLLRLDTDWYESTLHELTHLYPRLSKGGVLIVDDYGSHQGVREAVEQYFSNDLRRPFLARIDHGGVIGIKNYS